MNCRIFLIFALLFCLGRRGRTSADNDDDDFLNNISMERTKTFAGIGESNKFQSNHFLEVIKIYSVSEYGFINSIYEVKQYFRLRLTLII